MDLNRMRGLLAAPVASLFLILALCIFGVRRPAATGISIPMVRIHHNPEEPTDCGGWAEFLRLTKDGKTWINESEIPADHVAPAVATLMESRAERVVYVVVDSELPYGRFAEFLDKVAGATSDLHVVVISGEVRRTFEKSHDMCDLTYSANEFTSHK
ncbi:MAG: hypothetical protein ABSF28_11600 [Terracidiphilus sp.]|jgi:biopolymer transport protein ExbD